MLICAQYGRVSGLEQEADPASSARSNKRCSRTTIIDCWISLTSFVSFGTKSKMSICGGHDSDCTEVTPHRGANFQVKHFNSDIEQTQRGIILLVLLFKQPTIILLYQFLVKNTVSRPVFRVKIVTF